MAESSWRRYPGGKEISTGRGERIRRWFHRRYSHTFELGVTFRAVTFADHRSGWSGVKMDVCLGWWCFTRTVLAWKNGPRKSYQTITLAEQIRLTHGTCNSLEEEERIEEQEKADERERLRLLDEQIKEWDARHNTPNPN